MHGSGIGPSSDPNAKPAAVKLPDNIVRKQQALRRYLQNPASPAFNDPARAAELAGFPVINPARTNQGEDGRSKLFWNIRSIGQTIHDAFSRKTATISKLTQRVLEGMDATKIVTVSDRGGARRSVEVPDHTARREWAVLCARLQNLLPSKGVDPDTDTLSRDAARAEQQESLSSEVSRMSATDRFLVSQYFLKIDQYEGRIRRKVCDAKLGKSLEEFEDEIEQEVRSEMSEFMSRLEEPPTTCDRS